MASAQAKSNEELERDNRLATPEEQIILSKYVGWGGISKAVTSYEENIFKQVLFKNYSIFNVQ